MDRIAELEARIAVLEGERRKLVTWNGLLLTAGLFVAYMLVNAWRHR